MPTQALREQFHRALRIHFNYSQLCAKFNWRVKVVEEDGCEIS